MTVTLGAVMDAVILCLLAATVIVAFRLQLSLRHFKKHKADMEVLVARLVSHVDQAERAIVGMQNTARKTALDLDEIMNDAKVLSNELKMMNDVGNNLATRLEKLAERNHVEAENSLNDNLMAHDLAENDAAFFDDADLDEEYHLQSQAERELFYALKGGQSRMRGRA